MAGIYAAHFFAAFFLVNGIPHFVQGVSGSPFQSPFARPPGVGESSAIVNVLWGFTNFVIGYVLLFNFGDFVIGLNADTLVTGSAALLTSIALAWHFQRVRNSSA
ncbi:MAG: hypothetical protein DRR42_17875 [Gammaproteobacteria bacterium]|nr:MAG: hypothetical protein DRR42_17875 [Gammaproteobacteria bacterium]